MRPDVSIVIASWNTRQLLKDCLQSILANGGGDVVRIEVIVVDNASHDGSAEMVENEFPGVRLIRNQRNAGFAGATNQGMSIGNGRYLLLLNSDTLAKDGTFARMVTFADGRPEAGIVGCRVLRPNGSLQPSCFLFPSVLNLMLWCSHLPEVFGRSRFFGRALFTWWGHDCEREVDAVQGSCLLVRREAIDKVGLLDADYFMYGEETDWCWRMKRAGWVTLFSPCAEIVHFGGASSARMPVAMTLQLLGSHLLFLRKHRGRFSYRLGCLVVAALCVSRGLPWCVWGLHRRWCGDDSMLKRGGCFMKGTWRVLRDGAEGLFYRPPPRKEANAS